MKKKEIIFPVEVVSKEPEEWRKKESATVFITRKYSTLFFVSMVNKVLEKHGFCIIKAKNRSNIYKLMWLLTYFHFRIGKDVEVESFRLWIEPCKNLFLSEGNPLRSVLSAELKLQKTS